MTVKEVFAKYSGKEDISVYIHNECVGYNLDVTDEIYKDNIISNAQVQEYELFGDDAVGYRLCIRLTHSENDGLNSI